MIYLRLSSIVEGSAGKTTITIPIWKGKEDVGECFNYPTLPHSIVSAASSANPIPATHLLVQKHREKNQHPCI